MRDYYLSYPKLKLIDGLLWFLLMKLHLEKFLVSFFYRQEVFFIPKTNKPRHMRFSFSLESLILFGREKQNSKNPPFSHTWNSKECKYDLFFDVCGFWKERFESRANAPPFGSGGENKGGDVSFWDFFFIKCIISFPERYCESFIRKLVGGASRPWLNFFFFEIKIKKKPMIMKIFFQTISYCNLFEAIFTYFILFSSFSNPNRYSVNLDFFQYYIWSVLG